ncbi:hypothetical protein BJX96DRAFT_155678 [Aspergillus floccosus]
MVEEDHRPKIIAEDCWKAVELGFVHLHTEQCLVSFAGFPSPLLPPSINTPPLVLPNGEVERVSVV